MTTSAHSGLLGVEENSVSNGLFLKGKVMSNDNQLDRMWKLATKVHMLVLDNKRDAQMVADMYQSILELVSKLIFTTESGIAVYDYGDHFKFTLPATDGTTGKDWIERLEGNCFRVGDDAKHVLLLPSFNPTSGVKTEVAVLKGVLFDDNNQIMKKIRAEGALRKFLAPNPEMACLIRENFTDKEIEAMGLWFIAVMHEPVSDSDGGPSLLSAHRYGDARWLSACGGRPVSGWSRKCGFVFAVSQVSS